MKQIAEFVAIGALLAPAVFGQGFNSSLKIPIPQRAYSTPTQNLNRDGVNELKHGHREKAKKLFYKAYLLDPEDPFTLNNLGYVSELEGDATRALRYYGLAARNHTDAVIDQSSVADLKGKPLDAVFEKVQNADLQVNQINERAIALLQQGRTFAARNLLRSALPNHPRDPFLLNNLGYVMESVGDLNEALRCYSAAASLHSTEKVIVTPRLKWQGRAISEVAAENAAAVSGQIARGETPEAATARLNLRGVAALNDNQPLTARQFFLQAYQQDSQNAFTLNNLGYVSELAGDQESAESYYMAARAGRDANQKVSYSTRRDVEGSRIGNLADTNQVDVESTLKAMQQTRRRTQRPVELIRRNDGQVSQQKESSPVPALGVKPPAMPSLPPPDSAPSTQSPEPDNPQQDPQ